MLGGFNSEIYLNFFSFNLSQDNQLLAHFSFIKEIPFLNKFCKTPQQKQLLSKFIYEALEREIIKQYSAAYPKIRIYHRHLAMRVVNSEAGQLANSTFKNNSQLWNKC